MAADLIAALVVLTVVFACVIVLVHGLRMRRHSPRLGWALLAVAAIGFASVSVFAWHLYALRAQWHSDTLVISMLNLFGVLVIDWPLVTPVVLVMTVLLLGNDAKSLPKGRNEPR